MVGRRLNVAGPGPAPSSFKRAHRPLRDMRGMRTRGVMASSVHQPQQLLVGHSDRPMLGLITDALKRDGYLVASALDGLDLLDWLADSLLESGGQRRPDMVICELSLPGRRGLDLLADLRYSGWSIPFVLTAKLRDRRLIAAARRLGSVIVFESPFDLDDLRTAVSVLLDRRRIAEVFPARTATVELL